MLTANAGDGAGDSSGGVNPGPDEAASDPASEAEAAGPEEGREAFRGGKLLPVLLVDACHQRQHHCTDTATSR